MVFEYTNKCLIYGCDCRNIISNYVYFEKEVLLKKA